jgi:hypothetical protein
MKKQSTNLRGTLRRHRRPPLATFHPPDVDVQHVSMLGSFQFRLEGRHHYDNELRASCNMNVCISGSLLPSLGALPFIPSLDRTPKHLNQTSGHEVDQPKIPLETSLALATNFPTFVVVPSHIRGKAKSIWVTHFTACRSETPGGRVA